MKPAETAPPALPTIKPADRLGATLPVAPAPALEGADLTNVIVLAHRRSLSDIDAPHVKVGDGERPAPPAIWRDRAPWTALIAGALLLHLALVLAFMRDPAPMPSLALDSISVDIVLGGQTEAGLGPVPGPTDSTPSTPSKSAPEEQAKAEPPTETAEPEKPDLKPRIETETREPAREEAKPEELKTQEAKSQDAKPQEEAKPEEPKQEKPAEPQVAAAEPEPQVEVAEPEPTPAPTEQEPTPVAVTAQAEAEVTPPAPKPEQQKPVDEPSAQPPPPQDKPTEKPRHASKPAPARVAASQSGVGVGSSRDIRNWASQVSAHLARNKRYPAEALARGIGGTASVAFSLDGNGNVTSVRLVRSSGDRSLDRESQDLVRRASPFPPPPQGKASITVPVNYNVRTGQ